MGVGIAGGWLGLVGIAGIGGFGWDLLFWGVDFLFGMEKTVGFGANRLKLFSLRCLLTCLKCCLGSWKKIDVFDVDLKWFLRTL